ncbi:MAG: malonate decarboxylase acyl carrier protein [Caldimonas sp.]
MTTGIETLDFAFGGGNAAPPFEPVLVGVVASGNLEVLLEPSASGDCAIHVETSARGFGEIWAAVLEDFHRRHRLSGVRLSLNDMGATPAVVGLRLDQAAYAIGQGTAR